jgi:hypothetical protein
MGVTTYNRRTGARSRDHALRELASEIAIDLPPAKAALPKRPQKRQALGALTLSLYQIETAQRGGQHGVLVVFTTDLPSDAAILGIAFVGDGDRSGAEKAIARAIDSLEPPPAPVAMPERPVVQKARLSTDPPPTTEPTYGLDLRPLK